jgi:hypothetical protein
VVGDLRTCGKVEGRSAEPRDIPLRTCDCNAKSESFAQGRRGANPVEGRSAESREAIAMRIVT